MEPDEPDMNLWTCPRCGLVIDIGLDELAGDENVVKLRMAHPCNTLFERI